MAIGHSDNVRVLVNPDGTIHITTKPRGTKDDDRYDISSHVASVHIDMVRHDVIVAQLVVYPSMVDIFGVTTISEMKTLELAKAEHENRLVNIDHEMKKLPDRKEIE
ncbi:hypothetical protein LCGC14_1796640 [marine sediment metagenome]|uniref:Uncharacterized protein n=1 Tax=marine sediment metagenome TaxID=412755 RepID=A0A0F9GQX1_9ZZZZ